MRAFIPVFTLLMMTFGCQPASTPNTSDAATTDNQALNVAPSNVDSTNTAAGCCAEKGKTGGCQDCKDCAKCKGDSTAECACEKCNGEPACACEDCRGCAKCQGDAKAQCACEKCKNGCAHTGNTNVDKGCAKCAKCQGDSKAECSCKNCKDCKNCENNECTQCADKKPVK